MNKIFLLLAFCAFGFGGPPTWEGQKLFWLKKDQKAFVHITLKGQEIKESFEFSWTLYDGLNLVVHTKWRKYPKQLTFSKRRGLELHGQRLFVPLANPYKDEVKLYLEFVSFKDGKAKIRALLRDISKRVDAQFWPDIEVSED